MYEKQSYMRKFVMLEPNSVGYLNNKNNLKGYAKIEVRGGRGKIQLNIEKTKNINEDNIYIGNLLAIIDERPIKVEMGDIVLNENGKGNLLWKFNPESVGGTGIPFDKFNTVFIQLYENNSEKIIIPLVGYIRNKDNSIDILIKDVELKESIKHESENIDETENIEDVDNETNELNNMVEESSEDNSIKQDEGYVEKDQVPIQNETEFEQNENEYLEIENEEDIFVKDEEIENINERKTEGIRYETNNDDKYGHSINLNYDYAESSRNYSRHIANYSLNILKFFEKVNPLREELKGYTWWEIEYDKKNIYRGFLPFYNYIINTYYPYQINFKATTCHNLIRKYGHYIFGIAEENGEIKYYVYGIPGRFTKDEQPYRGMTGFTTWIPKRGRNRDRIGYWLLHIDAINGRIVSPLRPTYPR
ncbi:hypothetical protein SAMN02745135_00860 [Caloranaerobacter azorensis DSM 13643]|uniref:DUF7922 domain-containing protein n=1 Tax=Caloranaerobacter azorensis DSM 13643 TaxID=1121264 RepID=A0A1M5T6L8_9FIRM|nr:hypothetical protein [Caloranaerobacter azorensis]SHH46013.1 hypothetical protein SAMN02745135_00860 [Caloranaerobacter azorensis DSM 13643]